MNKALITAAIFAATTLAACGGGSTPIPTPVPTPAPTHAPATYTLALHITGGAEPRGGLSYVQKQSLAMDASTSTPPPVLMVAPDTTSGLGAFTVGTADGTAVATVSVSPVPSASPMATWSANTPNNVSVTTQSTPTIAGLATTQVNTTGIGSLSVTVTVGGVVQPLIQSSIITYPRVTVACPQVDQSSGPIPQEWVQGVIFDANGNPSATNDPTQADLYVTGPKCYGAFGSVESATTLHFPHGGHIYSDTFKAFNQYTASDYLGDETSMTIDAMQAASPMLTTITFKDALGTIHFVHFDTLGDLDRESGAHKACGKNPIDGSC